MDCSKWEPGMFSNLVNLIEHCALFQFSGNTSHDLTAYTLIRTINQSAHITSCTFDEESGLVNLDCPSFHSRSIIAHASLAVATLITLIHLTFILLINGSLLVLYSPCLITSLFFSAIHYGLLFFSRYATSRIQYFMRQLKENGSRDTLFWSPCLMTDLLVHSTAITIHLSLFVGLLQKYQKLSKPDGSLYPIPRADRKNRVKSANPEAPMLDSCLSSNRPKLTNANNFTFSQMSNRSVSVSYLSARRRHCFPQELHFDWNWMGPPASVCAPIPIVVFGLYATKHYSLLNHLNPAYGFASCGGVGSCLLAFQWLLFIPTGTSLLLDLILISLISLRIRRRHPGELFLEVNPHDVEYKATLRMYWKMVICQAVLWIVAFVSNHLCLMTLWQLYAILSALQSLFIIVSFVFSREFLEVIFKRNDSLNQLKLDNLIMNIPLGLRRPIEQTSSHFGAGRNAYIAQLLNDSGHQHI